MPSLEVQQSVHQRDSRPWRDVAELEGRGMKGARADGPGKVREQNGFSLIWESERPGEKVTFMPI